MAHVEKDFELFYKLLPKVELHAHLNGSLSDETLEALHKLQNGSSSEVTWNRWEAVIEHGDARTLEECFQMFDVAYSVTTSCEAIRLATQNVIQEFVDDGVCYLELRSTPRNLVGIMSKEQYVSAMVEAIRESSPKIIVKLLISVNRQHGKLAAEDTLQVALGAHNLYPDIVVGLDLGGNPAAGNIDDYLPIFHTARKAGLKTAIHIGEIPNEKEIEKILDFNPDRLGHASCIHPNYGGSENIWNKLLTSKIPVELCLTSNVKCKTVESYEKHHFKLLFSNRHPITLATDDKGVFSTTLSQEYQHAAEAFSMSKEQLWELSTKSLDFIFGSENDKIKIREIFMQKKTELILK